MTRSRQTADWGSRAGLAKVIPSSVAVGSGTGSADSLGTVTFSLASSVSLNNVFSSTYTSYRIVLNVYGCSVSPVNMQFRLRKNGTDNSSGYYYSSYYGTFAGSNGIKFNGTNQTSAVIMAAGSTYYAGTFDLTSPTTKCRLSGTQTEGGPHDIIVVNGFYHDVVDTFDGFTLFPASGTAYGVINVYGYN